MTAVVFDIGNVLVEWDPCRAWEDKLPDRDAIAAFMARVDFPALNLRGDRGESFASLAAEVVDPGDRALLLAYLDGYHRTIEAKIDGSWDLLKRLRAAGVAIHAITNWSHETWPIGVSVHPELGEVFGVTVVSGQEKLLKPEPAIFRTLLDRTGLAADDCLFIDDSPRNVDGARAVGMDAVHFTSPQALETALTERGLL
ncbi:HAD family hydrolase [Pseudodonghicola flavimaris]|uniref:HAD family phosphatase n=1 Tax=Pseudodonghicola flavimaris TaxID=3050036 RepID=A0ABT7F2Z6_9RHOB|nr:HAD family phosphatase [Pseudodonghicola flavimaris]MDK3018997.1 HAD family phosphatase [Pseudodonghicola flavimaris]